MVKRSGANSPLLASLASRRSAPLPARLWQLDSGSASTARRRAESRRRDVCSQSARATAVDARGDGAAGFKRLANVVEDELDPFAFSGRLNGREVTINVFNKVVLFYFYLFLVTFTTRMPTV